MNNLSNLLYLTRCGFYDCLEEGGLVGPNMDMQCRAQEPLQLSFSNIAALEQKPNNYFSEIQLCYHVVLEQMLVTVPWSCMVGLIQIPNPCDGHLL